MPPSTMIMERSMCVVRLIGLGLFLVSSLLTAAPAFAMGHRGDATQVSALRDAVPQSAPAAPVSAPEIGAGMVAGAVALVTGGLLLIRRR